MNRNDNSKHSYEEREVFRLTFQGVNEIVELFESKLFNTLVPQIIVLAGVKKTHFFL